MCGRYTLKTRRSDEIQARLAESLGVETPPSDRAFERFNIAPTQEVLAVVQDRDGRRIEELRWGLVPPWAKELKTRFSMINARAETLDRKPAYRRLVARAGHRWLDPSLDSDAARELLAPIPPHEMVVRPANPVVNSTSNDGPSCLVLPAAA